MKTVRQVIQELIQDQAGLGSQAQNTWYLTSILRMLEKDNLVEQTVAVHTIQIPYLTYSARFGRTYQDLHQIKEIEREFQQSQEYQELKLALEAANHTNPSEPLENLEPENEAVADYYFFLSAARACSATTTGAIVATIILASIATCPAVVFGAIAAVSAVSCYAFYKTAKNLQPASEPEPSLWPNCFA